MPGNHPVVLRPPGNGARTPPATPRAAPIRRDQPARGRRYPRRTRTDRRCRPGDCRGLPGVHRCGARPDSTCRSGGSASPDAAPGGRRPSRRTPPCRRRGPRCGWPLCPRGACARTPTASTTSRSGSRACPRLRPAVSWQGLAGRHRGRVSSPWFFWAMRCRGGQVGASRQSSVVRCSVPSHVRCRRLSVRQRTERPPAPSFGRPWPTARRPWP